MNPERWLQIKELFDQARTLPPNEQAAFLDSSCAADPSLREELERLLKSYESGFLEEPLLPEVGDIVGAASGFEPGKVIGRYRIRELIGTGGMGEVFLADDTELDRPVAIKVLHRDVAEDNERIRRFIQEARAASALNHPNILTIHEVGSFEGSRFIVSEYVDGETLRERMASGLTAAESLEITCQIAAALQAAHQAGIVHRDIKPENIMLRKDGLVKVLDFGLAKLTEADDLPMDVNAPTVSRLQTSPGLVMGTVAYMSPEQARGQAVDSRTDLWSLGVVFHEMLTGASPFKGESVTDLVSSILTHDPASLDLTEISQELQPICTKAFAKNQKARYQTALDLLQDLQGEKKRMEYAIQPTSFVTVSSSDELKTQMIRPRPTLSAEYIVTGMKRHKYATFASLALVTFLAVGFSVYKYNGAPASNGGSAHAGIINESTTERDLRISMIAASGQVFDLAISPDGKYIAYAPTSPDKGGLKLLDLESKSEIEVVPRPSEGNFWGIHFSPGGEHIYYSTRSILYRVPSMGGGPTKIAEDVDDPAAVSPDGKTIVFTRELDGGKGGEAILLANADGSNERTLMTAPPDNYIENAPAWSPDGKTIACQMHFKEGSDEYLKLVGINIADGKQQVLSDKKWADSNRNTVWLPNGNLIIAGKEKSAGTQAPYQIWLIAPGSEPKAITSGLLSYTALSATRTGDTLVALQRSVRRDLWVLPENDLTRARQVTTSGEICCSFSWMPDGRIVYASGITGTGDIWTMNSDGTGRKQLTREQGGNGGPRTTPDGKYILFHSDRTDARFHLFRMNADGSNVKQLTTGFREIGPRSSPDGKWIYYRQFDNNVNVANKISKIPVDGGEASVVVTMESGSITDVNIAPDGRIAYMVSRRGPSLSENRLYIISATGQLLKTLELPKVAGEGFIRWTSDGRSIAYNDLTNGAGDIWTLPVNGKGIPKPLVTYRIPATLNFDWTKDGKQLLLSRGSATNDPVLIKNSGK